MILNCPSFHYYIMVFNSAHNSYQIDVKCYQFASGELYYIYFKLIHHYFFQILGCQEGHVRTTMLPGRPLYNIKIIWYFYIFQFFIIIINVKEYTNFCNLKEKKKRIIYFLFHFGLFDCKNSISYFILDYSILDVYRLSLPGIKILF